MATVTAKPVSRKTAVKATHPAKPISRLLRWLYRHGSEGKGAIRLALTYGNRTELYRYWIEQIGSDFGTAYQLTKITSEGKDADTYHVNVANAQDTHCGCKGFERYGHCKHVDCCRAIASSK